MNILLLLIVFFIIFFPEYLYDDIDIKKAKEEEDAKKLQLVRKLPNMRYDEIITVLHQERNNSSSPYGEDFNVTQLLINELAKRHRWTLKAKEAVMNEKIYIGMTKLQAKAAWGDPEHKKLGIIEEWFYNAKNVYFENGILRDIQAY